MKYFTNKTLVAALSAAITIVSLVGHAQTITSNLSATEYVDLVEGFSHKNIIKPIYFDSGEAVIKNDEFSKLKNIINENPNRSLKVVFVGHTDNQKLSEKSRSIHNDNYHLSQNRAQLVMSKFQQQMGKNNNVTLTSIGVGAEQPVVSNNTQHGMSLNRRVEVHVIYDTRYDLQASLARYQGTVQESSYANQTGDRIGYVASGNTKFVKEGELAKLDDLITSVCTDGNCDKLETIDSPTVIEDAKSSNTIDEVVISSKSATTSLPEIVSQANASVNNSESDFEVSSLTKTENSIKPIAEKLKQSKLMKISDVKQVGSEPVDSNQLDQASQVEEITVSNIQEIKDLPVENAPLASAMKYQGSNGKYLSKFAQQDNISSNSQKNINSTEVVKLEKVSPTACVDNCNGLETLGGPVFTIENEIKTAEQKSVLLTKSLTKANDENEKQIATNNKNTQVVDSIKVEQSSKINAISNDSKLVAENNIVRIDVPLDSNKQQTERPLAVKSASQPETATLPKAEATLASKPVTKSVVRAISPAESVKKAEVIKANKNVAVSSKASEFKASQAKKQLAVKLSENKETVSKRTVAIDEENEQKEIARILNEKSQSTGKAACGGYAYGGCYDLAVKSDFKFRQALTIEAAPAVKVAAAGKVDSKQAERKLVQKVVKQGAKKTLALSKLAATEASKESSRSSANKEVREKSVQLAMASFKANKVEPKVVAKEVFRSCP